MINLIMQAAPAAPAGGNGFFMVMMLILLIFMYFMTIRPQQQRMKKHQAMLSEITRGDTIVTNGGLVGKVTKADDVDMTVQIAEGVKVKVARSMIADVRNRTAPANDTGKEKAKAKSKK